MRHILLASALVLTLIGTANAAPSSCPEHHLDGEMPYVVNDVLLTKAREICYSEFSIVHSGLTRTPLWAGEVLSRDRLRAARNVEREDAFVPESLLPEDERSELSDYSRSGYDRGHVAPAADMSTDASKRESFTLANIVPQTASSNRNEWADVERLARDIAMTNGLAFIVSGPLFLADRLDTVGRGVAVPTHMFKAIHVPHTGETGAYVVSNDNSPTIELINIDRLTELAGVDVFPTLRHDIKSDLPSLPRP